MAACPAFEIPGMPGGSVGMINLSDMMQKAMGGKRTKTRKTTVKESYEFADRRRVRQAARSGRGGAAGAMESAENDGIVFIDEIDKVAARQDGVSGGPFAAKACSAICCRWSKARPLRPNTGR
jgi:ATP-dependent HslUV protease ATP-binding subunit HslU